MIAGQLSGHGQQFVRAVVGQGVQIKANVATISLYIEVNGHQLLGKQAIHDGQIDGGTMDLVDDIFGLDHKQAIGSHQRFWNAKNATIGRVNLNALGQNGVNGEFVEIIKCRLDDIKVHTFGQNVLRRWVAEGDG